MATSAVTAELPLMGIVTAMAGSANSFDTGAGRDGRPVAGRAVQAIVGAGQRECSPGVMVEGPGKPSPWVVAGLAAWAQRSGMHVRLTVAVVT